jgi:hypothetical protein
MFNVNEYLESIERDYDYYLFWADDIEIDYFDELVLCDSLTRLQIKLAHMLMDNGQEKNYQEDGFILGEIIWANILKTREENGY